MKIILKKKWVPANKYGSVGNGPEFNAQDPHGGRTGPTPLN